MGYVCKATFFTKDGDPLHSARVRWRSDDPWGTIWRALHAVCGPHIPEEVDRSQDASIATVCLELSFEQDCEDVNAAISPLPPPELVRGRAKLPKGVKT